MRQHIFVFACILFLGAGTTRTSSIDASIFVHVKTVHAASAVQSVRIQGYPVAGIVNHHVLAADLIAQLLDTVKRARPTIKRFIIIAPDHYRSGRFDISATTRSYHFGTQIMRTDAALIHELAKKNIVHIENDEMFEREHGIGAIIPFILSSFPKAKIIPITISSSAKKSSIDKIKNALKNIDDGETFFLVSSDMSHYLSVTTARRNDVHTEKWLANLDVAKLGAASDDFMDNGRGMQALALFLKQKNQNPRFTRIGHAVSSEYGGSPEYTTSYITGLWTITPSIVAPRLVGIHSSRL